MNPKVHVVGRFCCDNRNIEDIWVVTVYSIVYTLYNERKTLQAYRDQRQTTCCRSRAVRSPWEHTMTSLHPSPPEVDCDVFRASNSEDYHSLLSIASRLHRPSVTHS